MSRWPDRHPLPPFGRRYGHADGALMLTVPTVRTLLDVLEVDLSPYHISEQGARLVLERGRHACMLTISAPTQPDGEAPPALVHMSVSRGRAGIGAAPPDPAVAREFEQLLLDCWPGVTEHDRNSGGVYYTAAHYSRQVGVEHLERLITGVEFWGQQRALKRPARAWAAFCPVAAAARDGSTLRQLVRWGARSMPDVGPLLAVSAMATVGALVVAVDGGLLDALLRTDPPDGDVLMPFGAMAIDLQQEVDGARVLILTGLVTDGAAPHRLRCVVPIGAGWPRCAPVGLTATHTALVANVIAYMTSVDAGTTKSNSDAIDAARQAAERKPPGRKRDKALRRVNGTAVITTVRLGGSTSATPSSTESTIGGQRRQHWVRGHWRSQPYGPRSVPLADRPRRLRFIAPHQRGDDAVGVVVGRTYIAQGEG